MNKKYYVVRYSGDDLQYYIELMGWSDVGDEDAATEYDSEEYAQEVADTVGGYVVPAHV